MQTLICTWRNSTLSLCTSTSALQASTSALQAWSSPSFAAWMLEGLGFLPEVNNHGDHSRLHLPWKLSHVPLKLSSSMRRSMSSTLPIRADMVVLIAASCSWQGPSCLHSCPCPSCHPYWGLASVTLEGMISPLKPCCNTNCHGLLIYSNLNPCGLANCIWNLLLCLLVSLKDAWLRLYEKLSKHTHTKCT